MNNLGERTTIIPAEVKGYFHSRRQILQWILLAIFLVLPWIHIQGQQMVWLNLSQWEFHLFGLQLFSHEAPLIFLLLIVAAMGLAFMTSVYGRVWCGWACPQTVFIEQVYRRIDRWVEGGYIERRRLRDSDLGWEKSWKILLRWFLYVLVSSIIAHSFAAYFLGAVPMIQMVQGGPSDHFRYFALISGLTLLFTVDFGWFREQFCVIVCPYGRIQSLLLDSASLSVTYDEARGEPRKGVARGIQKTGDCVSCQRCVNVCPTGIDIRNGLQMECIGCTACIDACDEIMVKVKKPTGLIRYSSLEGKPAQLLRPRALVYFAGVLISLAVVSWQLWNRGSLDVVVLRGLDSPYQLIQDEQGNTTVINHFRLKIRNSTRQEQKVALESSEQRARLVAAENPFKIAAAATREVHFFVQFPKGTSFPDNHLPLRLQSVEGPIHQDLSLPLVAPEP